MARSTYAQGANRDAFSLPAMLGGQAERNPDILALRWLGTANFEINVGGRVVLLDCFYDRGPRMRSIGFAAMDVTRAEEIFIGHPHYDHIADAAPVAAQTGAVVIGHPLASDEVIRMGLDAEQTRGYRGLGEGDVVGFGEYRVRILHGFHLLADEDLPPPGPGIQALRQARELWESDLGPLSADEQAEYDRIFARGSMDKAVLEDATMCMVFEFGDFKLVYRDSAGPISAEEAAYFGGIDGVDAAIVGFIGRPLMRRQLDERTLPLVDLYRPKVLVAAHHDDLYPTFLDMATEPLKMAVSHLLPTTTTVAPVYLEPVRIHMPTGMVLGPNQEL
jgi:L-ascorbate metabolism protein UlaG (beta-lactamase superfamily)